MIATPAYLPMPLARATAAEVLAKAAGRYQTTRLIECKRVRASSVTCLGRVVLGAASCDEYINVIRWSQKTTRGTTYYVHATVRPGACS